MRRSYVVFAVLTMALATVPVWAPLFWVNEFSQAMIFAILAMSLDLVLGYAGLPSLGHAAFYGVGAYAVAMLATRATVPLPVLLLTAMVAAGIFAAVIGGLALRARGIVFLMLTFAMGQMLWALAERWTPVTGGSDGLFGVLRPSILGLSIGPARNFYLVVLICTLATFLLLAAITRSPFGKTLAGVRENENRSRAMGYPTVLILLAAFVIAGALAGLGGALAAYLNGYSNPGQLHWTTSAIVLVAVVLGGRHSLIGPALGAAFIVILQTGLSGISDRWALVLGVLLIAVVLLAPQGAMGLVRRARNAA